MVPNLPLLYSSQWKYFSFALLKAEQWSKPRRMQRCSYNPCKLCLTLPIDRQRPNTRVFAVCIPHRVVLQARSSFFCLVSQDKQLCCTYLAISRRKPQTAAYAMKFEMLRAETELAEQGLKFHADLVTPLIGGNMGSSAYHRSSCISNLD